MPRMKLELTDDNALQALCVMAVEQRAIILSMSALLTGLYAKVHNVDPEQARELLAENINEQAIMSEDRFSEIMAEIEIARINKKA